MSLDVGFRVMVLDCGEVKEFDSPQTLLLNENSLFFKMAADAKVIDGVGRGGRGGGGA